ncbi:MAG: YfhO family protein [Lachnospiraceae bacterium]|nr:YfhO family protein [Lachnospiraceae bacterium]
MKKETVVRQNRCDKEMNFLLFVCFFFFMAMQLFVGDTQKLTLVNCINMMLYMVFVPGFIFRLGYCWGRLARTGTETERKQWLGFTALRYFAYYFCLAFAFEVSKSLFDSSISRKKLLLSVFADVLTFLRVPAVSAVFFSMLLILLFVWGFDRSMLRLAQNKKRMAALGVLLLLGAFLRSDNVMYTFMAALVGSSLEQAVPAVPYFAFFLLGIWFEEKKPGFQWKLFGIAGAVTLVSLLLYRTPLQDLCRVTASFLPVYLVYAAAEGLSDVTLRLRPAELVCGRIEFVFCFYAVMMFGLRATGKVSGFGVSRTLILAVCALLFLLAGFLVFWLFTKGYGILYNYFYGKAKHKTAVYFIVYTIAFSFLLFLVFFDFIWRGKTFIIFGDGVAQYFPRTILYSNYIKDMVSGLLSGNFVLPMYDFRNGLGSEVAYSLEPLYALYALFDENHMELAYNMVTVLRFYLAGVTSSILLLYFKKDYFAAFMGSVVYVICGFALYGGAMHTMFMIPMIMLPLLILSIEEILRHRRFYLCTIFVAVSLLSNYYFLYMNTIAMGIYFIVRFLCQKERERRTFKKFIGRGLVISGSYLMGVGIGFMTLATTFGQYLGSGRNGAAMIKTASLFYYRAEWLLSCFQTFLTTANSPGEWLKLGYLPIAMLAVVILFARKGRKELKIFSVISLIFMLFPVFGFIFSGFSTVINRWCYMAALVVGYTVADCLPDLLRMQKKEKRLCAVVVAVYGFLAFFGNYYKNTSAVKIAAILLVITFVTVLLCQDEWRWMSSITKKCLLLALTAAIVFYQGFSLYEIRGRIDQYASTGYTLDRLKDTPIRAVKELEDNSFYRSAVPKLVYDTGNSSILLDYYSTSLLNSTYNGYVNQYLRMMGNTSFSSMQYLGMNNRLFENDLAAVKYYASYENMDFPIPYGYEEVLDTEVEGKAAKVYENQYALPIGYTYDSIITEEELEEYNVLERQEVLMQQVLLHSAEISEGEKAAVTTVPLEILSSEGDGVRLTKDKMIAGDGENGGKADGKYKLTLHFDGKADSETYLVLHNAFLEGDMSEDPIKLTITAAGSSQSYSFEADDYRYHTGQEDFVFNLGYHEEPVDSCTITMKREGVIQFEELALYSQPMENVPEYTKALTENVLENVVVDTNEVSGTISLDKDKVLVLSIPYQNGWTAYVDGKETELQRANYAYMALPLTAGDHTIELSFAIPGVKYAMVIVPGSVILFAAVCIISWLIKKRKKRKMQS